MCPLCLSGLSLMARYGDPVIEWWNQAFEEVMQSGEYQLLCDAAATRHGERDRQRERERERERERRIIVRSY